MQRRQRVLVPLAGLALGLMFVSAASALNAPVLLSVGHEQRHPKASWTLPANVEAWSVEVARSPEQASDGSFFTENVVQFDLVATTDTYWLSADALQPGTYYVLVTGYDNSCFVDAGECGVVRSNVLPLVIPSPPPRYQATARSTHPGAIVVPGSRREWTYYGDTVRIAFRNATGQLGQVQSYRVCYQRGARPACATRTLRGSSWDAWRLRIVGKWVPCRTREIRVWWVVERRRVATRSVWVYECGE